MRIELHLVGWKDYRPWLAKSGSVAGSLAWSNVDDGGTGHVFVRRGAHLFLFALARLGHEIEHCLDNLFGNDEHHPFTHFCLRSYNPIRTWSHATFATKEQARKLRREGWLQA